MSTDLQIMHNLSDKCGCKYNGQLRDNKYHGKGQHISCDGYTEEGIFKNDFLNGYGRRIFPNGEIFEGVFLDGNIQDGKKIYINGPVYKGTFLKNKPHGIGFTTCADKTIYKGYFENGELKGICKIYYPCGMIYEGTVKNNKCHGYGRLTYINGIIYQGNFENGKRHGSGKILFTDKSIFESIFTNDTYDGSYELIYLCGRIYQGNDYFNSTQEDEVYLKRISKREYKNIIKTFYGKKNFILFEKGK